MTISIASDNVSASNVTAGHDKRDVILAKCAHNDPIVDTKNGAKGTKTGALEEPPGEGTLDDARKVAPVVIDIHCVPGVESALALTLLTDHVPLVHHATLLVEVLLNSVRPDGA